MGNVKDRYIHYEKAGDQFTGRSVTGISSVTKEFTISPVYQDYTDCGEEGKNYVIQTITDLDVNADHIEPPMFELLQYLFASLCYHYNFLRENICTTSKLNASPLYNSIESFEYLTAARVVFPWDITSYTPHFTGIPPHIIILSDFEKLQIQFKQQEERFVNSVKQILDERSAVTVEYQTSKFLEEIKNILNEKTEMFQNKITNNDNINNETKNEK